MAEWWMVGLAAYVGFMAGAWLVLTVRDGRPVENLVTVLALPLLLIGWLASW